MMNREDILKCLSILKLNYPSFYKTLDRESAEALIALWLDILKDEDPAEVMAAIKSVIATDSSTYPPSIGVIRNMLRRFDKPIADTASDGWNEVRQAIKGSVYFAKAQENFEKLSPITKQILGSPSQLRDYAMMSPEDFNSVAQSNFLRAYRAREKAMSEINALTNDVREMIEQKTGTMLLSGRNTNLLCEVN